MNLIKDYYIVTVEIKDPDRPTHWDRTILDGKLCVFLHWHTIATTRVESFNVDGNGEEVNSVTVETKNTIYHFTRLEI